jgi:hypothetical protein
MTFLEESLYNPKCTFCIDNLATHKIVETGEMMCDDCTDMHLYLGHEGTLECFKPTPRNENFTYQREEELTDDELSQMYKDLKGEEQFEIYHDHH